MTDPIGSTPTTTSNPAGITGGAYGDAVNIEAQFLAMRVPRRLTVTGTNALVGVSPAGHADITALSEGMRLSFVPPNANTGAMTIKPDTLAAIDLLDHDGAALTTGQVRAGRPVEAEIDAAGKARIIIGLSPTSTVSKIAVLVNRQTNAYGGTLTSGSDQTIALNTKLTDTIGLTGTLPDFVLPAGTYDFDASVIISDVDAALLRLYNVTDAADVSTVIGLANRALTSDNDFEITARGRFTLAAPKTLRLVARVQTTKASEGQGGSNEAGGYFTANAINYSRVIIEEARGNVAGAAQGGNFTPAVAGTTAAGAGTYTTQTGHYEKVGNLVFFDLELAWTAHTGTGNITITGLPYVSGARRSALSVNWSNLTFANTPQAYVEASAQYIALVGAASAGAVAALAMDTAATLRVSGAYSIA